MVFTSQQSFKKSSGNSSSGGDDSKKRKSMMNRGASSKFDKKSGTGYRGHGGRGGSRKIDDYSAFDMNERRPGGGGRGGGGKENVVDKRFYDGEKDILCLCFGIMYKM